MEKVKTFRVYNLLNENGDKLRLCLGYVTNTTAMYEEANQILRWCFNGKKIPMPVRSGCWFNGFPENIMLDWLKGNGWHLRTRVDLDSGHAVVFDLPDSKGNEEYIDSFVDKAIICAMKLMWTSGKHIKAIHLYRHLYGGTLDEAAIAVKGIVDRQI